MNRVRKPGLRVHIKGLTSAVAWFGIGIGASALTAPALGQAATAANSTPSPTVASPIDASVDQLVGCVSGGDLYFRIGAHQVRVDSKLWRLSVRLHGAYVARTSPFQACQAAPLRVRWLHVLAASPNYQDSMPWGSAILAEGTDPEFKKIRDDFLPHESTCRRGPHWTWCGTEKTVQVDEKTDPDGTSPYVSLKFDLDFYRTPTGSAFFVNSLGDPPLYLRPWGVTYRWDESLVVAYGSYPCTRATNGQMPNCSPLNLIEIDRKVRSTVRSLLVAPSAAGVRPPKAPTKREPGSAI